MLMEPVWVLMNHTWVLMDRSWVPWSTSGCHGSDAGAHGAHLVLTCHGSDMGADGGWLLARHPPSTCPPARSSPVVSIHCFIDAGWNLRDEEERVGPKAGGDGWCSGPSQR